MKSRFMNNFFKNTLVAILLILIGQACNDKPAKVNSNEEKQKSIFIKGAFFQGANGIYFDDQDRLYVASVVSRLIGIVDTETGEIIETLGPKEGIEGPDDLTFGPDGSLYHTSILTGEVGKRDSNGMVVKQFVSPGANPITFSDDGRLFVALDFQGDGLYELDPDLKKEPRLIIKELGWLNGMDFGPDGFLYGPIWSKGQIVKIDVDQGSLEIIIDDLDTPAAVKFNSKGELHTVDHQSGIVYKIDVSNGTKTEIARGFIGADNIAFNSKDELFLSHAQDGSIHEINMDGTSRVIIAPALCNAADLEVVDGALITPDILSMKKFNLKTGEQNGIWNHMIGRQGIIGPFTIDHEGGQLALTSWFGNEVQVWDLASNSSVSVDHDYMVPINAILENGSLIVAELGTEAGAAKVTRTVGKFRETLIDGSKGLIVPSGLAAANGNIYAADFFKGVVFKLTENDKILQEPQILVSGLKQPEGLQIAQNGDLLIVETGANQILSYNLKSGEQKVLIADIPLGLEAPAGMAPTWMLSDVHFDEKGSLYVPSDVENIIYKYNL